MDEQDYHDTIEDAKDLEDGHEAGRRKRDAELAFEALAAASSMGLFGSEQQVTELIELELARQLCHRLEPVTPKDDERY